MPDLHETINQFLEGSIASIGRDPVIESKSITANGTYTAPEGVDGYSPVVVNVPPTEPVIESKNISENGTYTAPEGVDGYSPVVVSVPEKTLTTKSITANGTYNASDDNADGYSQVNVNVPLPSNAYLKKTATTSMSDAEQLPVASAVVSVTDKDKAELFLTSDGVVSEDNTPYTYRQSPSGKSYVDLSVVGGTVAWNQLVQSTDTSCTVPNTHKYIFHHGTTYDVAISDGTAFTVDGSANDNVHDITQAFGTTIADYIYSLEQATAGSGIAWLKSYGYLTKDYYAYDSGSLQSVNVASRKVYDSNDTLVATYPLDSDLTLRGIPKLDANNNLYYDGDIYNADGSVKRKYGIVDLGSLNWTNMGTSDKGFYTDVITMKGGECLCAKYTFVDGSSIYVGEAPDKSIGLTGSNNSYRIRIKDTSYTADTSGANNLKTSLNGVYLVYELATPTTESAQPYTNPQLVGSTEEFVDAGTSASTPTRDVAIPVGQDSKYVNGNIYIKYLDSVTTGDIELADENAIIPLENTTYISSNGSASIDYWSKED